MIVLLAVCVATVPLCGGRLQRLATLRLRLTWLPVVALAAQVVIVTIAPGGNPSLHAATHVATYALLGAFLVANRHVPGAAIVGLGTLFNASAIVVNRGVMPASAAADRLAGLHLGAGFHNSDVLAHPLLSWLGDVIPVPGPLPNVLSAGDLLVFAGTLVLLHRTCSRRTAATAASPA